MGFVSLGILLGSFCCWDAAECLILRAAHITEKNLSGGECSQNQIFLLISTLSLEVTEFYNDIYNMNFERND